jgi:hypothetical protein
MRVLDWAQVRERAFPDLPLDSSVTPGATPHAAWPGAAVVAGVGGSASPVSRRVLRLARSAGQPPVCSVRAAAGLENRAAGAKPSWVRVSLDGAVRRIELEVDA